MGHLERNVAGPTAEPNQIVELVSSLPSDTMATPRNLSAALLRRLNEVAAHHSGRVPLHGRLFAQWMHHAYPRECPFPHEAGTTNPQTPDEWMRETGHQDSHASQAEREETCSDMEAHEDVQSAGDVAATAAAGEL